jgi:hypothetical protein
VVERGTVEPVGFVVEMGDFGVLAKAPSHETGLVNAPFMLDEPPRVDPLGVIFILRGGVRVAM